MEKEMILLSHGSGGKLSHQLLEELIIPCLSVTNQRRDDAAVLDLTKGRLAFTTDSYVVDPIFFPGGDIGHLAVNGTINDLAMVGARPLYLSIGLILEEGFDKGDLRTILLSMKDSAESAGISIVTGDTKVVPRGKGDKIYINTAGIGILDHQEEISGSNARLGDKIIISGSIGDHGIAVLSRRQGLKLQTEIVSDCAPLHTLVQEILAAAPAIHVLRDPTRGGVATTLKEISLQSQVTITINEGALPMKAAVKGVCSILGLDPLYLANEGKLLAFVAPESANDVLLRMKRNKNGEEAAIIGEVTSTGGGKVQMITVAGGMRAVEMLTGEQLPRIC